MHSEGDPEAWSPVDRTFPSSLGGIHLELVVEFLVVDPSLAIPGHTVLVKDFQVRFTVTGCDCRKNFRQISISFLNFSLCFWVDAQSEVDFSLIVGRGSRLGDIAGFDTDII